MRKYLTKGKPVNCSIQYSIGYCNKPKKGEKDGLAFSGLTSGRI